MESYPVTYQIMPSQISKRVLYCEPMQSSIKIELASLTNLICKYGFTDNPSIPLFYSHRGETPEGRFEIIISMNMQAMNLRKFLKMHLDCTSNSAL
jgi:hypothetical protein